MNWKVGDRAKVNLIQSKYHGQGCIVLAIHIHGIDINGCEFAGNQVDLPLTRPSNVNPKALAIFRDHELIHIPDDKHKRFHKALISSQWSDCAFNPMVTVESNNAQPL